MCEQGFPWVTHVGIATQPKSSMPGIKFEDSVSLTMLAVSLCLSSVWPALVLGPKALQHNCCVTLEGRQNRTLGFHGAQHRPAPGMP